MINIEDCLTYYRIIIVTTTTIGVIDIEWQRRMDSSISSAYRRQTRPSPFVKKLIERQSRQPLRFSTAMEIRQAGQR